MSTYEQQGAWCLLFNKFIPKSELPHLGQVLYLQFRSPPPRSPRKTPNNNKTQTKKRDINLFEAAEGGARVLFGNVLFTNAYFDDFEQILFAGMPGTV